jgi:hypothetical protein
MAIQKFNDIATADASTAQRTAIADAVANLERISVRELMQRLSTLDHNSDAPQRAGMHRKR